MSLENYKVPFNGLSWPCFQPWTNILNSLVNKCNKKLCFLMILFSWVANRSITWYQLTCRITRSIELLSWGIKLCVRFKWFFCLILLGLDINNYYLIIFNKLTIRNTHLALNEKVKSKTENLLVKTADV